MQQRWNPGKIFLRNRFKIPEPIGVVLIFLTFFFVFFVFIYSLFPLLISQYGVFLESLPKILEFFQNAAQGTFLQDTIDNIALDDAAVAESVKNIFSTAGSGLFNIFNGIVDLILFFILTFLFCTRPDGVDNFFAILAPPKYRAYVIDLWKRTQKKMSQWFQGQLILIVLITILIYLPLELIGVPNAFFLAAFAGLMEIIPIFGPVLGAIPAILMALATGDLTTVVSVILLFFIVQQFENHLIYPLVVTKVVGVPPVLVILAIVVGGSIAGVVGIIIAVPIVGGLQELYEDIRLGKVGVVKGAS